MSAAPNCEKMRPNKTKILFIGPKPPPYSGPELSMELFLQSKLKTKYEILFVKTNLRKSNKNKGKLDVNSLLSFPIFFTNLVSVLLWHRPPVAYYPVTPTQLGWVGRDALCILLCRLFRARTIIHMRGSHLNLNFGTFHPVVQRLVRFACRSVSIGIVQGERLRDQFSTLLPDSRIRVLYQAIDTAAYDTSDVGCGRSVDVLFMGHLTHAKGYCDLLRCIPAVADAVPDVRFVVAGTKRQGERGVFFNQLTGERLVYEEPEKLEEAICSGKYKQNYKYLGVVKDAEKLERMRQSAVFVLPSYSEGFSRALLEAMSLGLPIVCTPVGAHAEIIQDGRNGYVVDPGDTGMLAQRIIALLQDSELRRKMAQENYEYARRRFDIDRIADTFSTYIDQAINDDA